MEIGQLITALISGGFIGAVLGFIGAGGAMVSVPILLYLFDFSPAEATTAALAVVFLAAVAGLRPKFKSKDVLVKEALTIWLLGLITNIGFGLLVERISDSVILIGFSVVLLGAAYSMLVKPIKDSPERKMSVWALVTLSLLIGSLTGLFGIGGGFLAIPVLVLFFHTPQNKAAGTSLLIIALNCLTALAAKFAIWSEIDWGYPLLISVAAVLVAGFASKKAAKTPTVHLKRGFAFLLIGLAGFTILTQV
ncbi:unannotated protein [freshwater metagenome]|jgi:uncharacterized protein|uniref:Unannotated protein n=1 Tax=freshwater metagenome TaxID=449393 RepID=A0A6J6Z7D1_9ZZZZ|nr:TSUP family transporter [Actinomycetota bacterium]